MMIWIGTGKNARRATRAERRGALKAYVLDSLAIVVGQDTWDSWLQAVEELDLTEEELGEICQEIKGELHRRSNKLPYIPIRAVLP